MHSPPCAIGEAVNGPGGYFGLSMQAFDEIVEWIRGVPERNGGPVTLRLE